MTRILIWTSAALFALTPHPAPAEVIDWALYKIESSEQTANDTPPAAESHIQLGGDLLTDNAADFSAVSLQALGGGISFATEDGFSWELNSEFATEEALDGFLGATAPSIDADSALGTIREPISPLGDFPELRPFFTGQVFEALQGMDPTADFELTWNDASVSQEVNEVFLFVDDIGPDPAPGDGEVFFAGGLTSTAIVVPADTLQSGRQYRVGLVFASIGEGERDSFATGEEVTATANETTIVFTPAPVPEPRVAGALVALVGASVLTTRRGARQQSRRARPTSVR